MENDGLMVRFQRSSVLRSGFISCYEQYPWHNGGLEHVGLRRDLGWCQIGLYEGKAQRLHHSLMEYAPRTPICGRATSGCDQHFSWRMG